MAMVGMADLTAALKEMLAPMLKEILKEALAPLLARMDKIEARMDKIDSHLDKIESRLDTIDTRLARLEAARANEDVRRLNSLRAVGAPLAPLPFTHEGAPWPQDVQQPARMLDLAVSGAEQLPGGDRPNWSRGQSRRFLACAVAPPDDDSDGEDEGTLQARTTRMRVMQLMGGSFERVSRAVLSLH